MFRLHRLSVGGRQWRSAFDPAWPYGDHLQNEIILAALRYLAAELPPALSQRQRSSAGSAHFLPGPEAYESDEPLDASRLVWVVGKQVTHLGYLWDVEGVYTALVPGHGLVKLGRLGQWHRVRYRQTLSSTCAGCTSS
jgi:hypothetical protein